MTSSVIQDAADFICTQFKRFPHYSFGKGEIMSNHSLTVHKFALELAKDTNCNQEVVELCALFHDIGKTIELDPETLERDHEILGWKITEQFLEKYSIADETLKQIESFFQGEPSIERTIVKEADILAFYDDFVLQEAFVLWARDKGKEELVTKKKNKFSLLKLNRSKELGSALSSRFCRQWGLESNVSA